MNLTGSEASLTWVPPVASPPGSVAITDPSGATIDFDASLLPGGQYSLPYTPDVPGVYTLEWSDKANVGLDSFIAIEQRSIVTVEEVRTWLRLRSSDYTDDATLQMLIGTAIDQIEDVVGTVFPQVYEEAYNGGNNVISLLHTPVMQVLSVSESWGPQSWTLRPAIAPPFDQWGYVVDSSSGTIARRLMGVDSNFAPGYRNITVRYVAGMQSIPPVIRLATMILVKNLYDSTIPNGRASTEPAYLHEGMPAAVMELLQPYLRPAGIA